MVSIVVVDMGSSVFPVPSLVMSDSSTLGLCTNTKVGTKFNPIKPSSFLHKFPSRVTCQKSHLVKGSSFLRKENLGISFRKAFSWIPRSTGSSSSEGSQDNSDVSTQSKAPFGYTRKDVLLIGLGMIVAGVGLKSGMEFAGVDPLQAGNVVQLVMVLGLTVGWISTYIFRVSNKDMTYVQQLRDYEKKVMEKRLEGLSEAELQALLQQVEEEKQRMASGEQVQ